MKNRLTFFFLILIFSFPAYSATWSDYSTVPVLEGFATGMALWFIGRFISWGIQLIKHMLEVPKGE